MKCQCEQTKCRHKDESCLNNATVSVYTIYGKFEMCAECSSAMPVEYIK